MTDINSILGTVSVFTMTHISVISLQQMKNVTDMSQSAVVNEFYVSCFMSAPKLLEVDYRAH